MGSLRQLLCRQLLCHTVPVKSNFRVKSRDQAGIHRKLSCEIENTVIVRDHVRMPTFTPTRT